MGMKPIEFTWTINVAKPHQVIVRRVAGKLSDTLSVTVDGTQVLSVPSGGFSASRGRHQFTIDDSQLELRWIWSGMTGDPAAIVLMEKEKILASSGTPEAIAKASSAEFSSSRPMAMILTIAAVAMLGAVGALWIFVNGSASHAKDVASPRTLIHGTETFKGGDVLFRYTDKYVSTIAGYSKEIPFKQLDLKIVVASKDDPNFYWAYQPRMNAAETKGVWEQIKSKQEWRQVKGGQTFRTTIAGQDAHAGGTFLFWNKNFADPITFEVEVNGTCEMP